MSSSIRNFAIISHIDHGKSTLADRLMELTGLLPRIDKPKSPRIDRMELEIERGVTIKLKAVRLPYTLNAKPYTLNMIDTPGHVDFSYEVSRSLAACEGALLLVDATQGPQAQTVAHLEKAKALGLTVIGIINKIDSSLARVEESEEDMRRLGIEGEILRISALKGQGIEAIPETIIKRVPPPKGDAKAPSRALVFDSTYDEHLGVIAYVRVVDGKSATSDQRPGIRFLGTGKEAKVKEIGYFGAPATKEGSARRAGSYFTPSNELLAGEVGYIATGLKDPQSVRVGDTVVSATSDKQQATRVEQLPGYREPQSFVFASFFAAEGKPRRKTLRVKGAQTRRVGECGVKGSAGGFAELKEALEKLRLEEPAVSVEETFSPALGRGFKLGFLGTFHLEIVKERLEREFDLDIITTKPIVAFRGLSEEPWIRTTVITPPGYLSGVTKLIIDRRGKPGEVVKFGARMRLSAELPLMEFVKDFYDRLKSLSSGYASLDWEFIGYRPADLVKLDIAVHGEVAEGLSEIVLKDQAQRTGKAKVEKLKEVMPRKQFGYALQAKIGGKIVARADVPAMRKDVTGHLYGGDVTRKRKLLKKQKKGKKRLAVSGKVEVPPQAFLV